jgi:hypothetical protein
MKTKGIAILTVVVIAALIPVTVLAGTYIMLTQTRIHLFSHVVTQVYTNKAQLALLSILSKTRGNELYSWIIVKDLERSSEVSIDFNNLMQELGFDCYKIYIKEINKVLAQSNECKLSSFAETKIPLSNKKYYTLSIGVGYE